MRALAAVWRVGFASQAGAEEFSRPAWVGEELPLCARAPPLNSPTQTEEDRRLLTRGLGSEATRWVVRALQPAAGGASRVVVAPSLHSLYSAASSAGQYELEAQVGPGKMLLWCADPERVLKTLKPIQGLPEPTRKRVAEAWAPLVVRLEENVVRLKMKRSTPQSPDSTSPAGEEYPEWVSNPGPLCSVGSLELEDAPKATEASAVQQAREALARQAGSRQDPDKSPYLAEAEILARTGTVVQTVRTRTMLHTRVCATSEGLETAHKASRISPARVRDSLYGMLERQLNEERSNPEPSSR